MTYARWRKPGVGPERARDRRGGQRVRSRAWSASVRGPRTRARRGGSWQQGEHGGAGAPYRLVDLDQVESLHHRGHLGDRQQQVLVGHRLGAAEPAPAEQGVHRRRQAVAVLGATGRQLGHHQLGHGAQEGARHEPRPQPAHHLDVVRRRPGRGDTPLASRSRPTERIRSCSTASGSRSSSTEAGGPASTSAAAVPAPAGPARAEPATGCQLHPARREVEDEADTGRDLADGLPDLAVGVCLVEVGPLAHPPAHLVVVLVPRVGQHGEQVGVAGRAAAAPAGRRPRRRGTPVRAAGAEDRTSCSQWSPRS